MSVTIWIYSMGHSIIPEIIFWYQRHIAFLVDRKLISHTN